MQGEHALGTGAGLGRGQHSMRGYSRQRVTPASSAANLALHWSAANGRVGAFSQEELAERKQRNQAAFQAWLAQDAERRKERGLKAREAGDKQTIGACCRAPAAGRPSPHCCARSLARAARALDTQMTSWRRSARNRRRTSSGSGSGWRGRSRAGRSSGRGNRVRRSSSGSCRTPSGERGCIVDAKKGLQGDVGNNSGLPNDIPFRTQDVARNGRGRVQGAGAGVDVRRAGPRGPDGESRAPEGRTGAGAVGAGWCDGGHAAWLVCEVVKCNLQDCEPGRLGEDGEARQHVWPSVLAGTLAFSRMRWHRQA